MRHYMVDPDNEERLLKIPPHVRDAIRTEALLDAFKAVSSIPWKADETDLSLGRADGLGKAEEAIKRLIIGRM